ncbi:vesicular glutamate transporter 2 [Plakobranchus ocellatus]|uniref:Vesicular glutamate transporter 2 n=1 Tax=Plakobranchus ocellatus TaxID=259542 RepID=A0AAV3ZYG8_9GAST|nr:vesicular glutamate transporter 2 [Plakobranchus ocellatus]
MDKDGLDLATQNSSPLLADSVSNGVTSRDIVSNGKVNGDLEVESKVDKGPPNWRSQRYILGYFLFAGMANLFFQRVNLSVAIVCMVNHTAISNERLHSHSLSLPSSSSNSTYTESQPLLDKASWPHQASFAEHQNSSFTSPTVLRLMSDYKDFNQSSDFGRFGATEVRSGRGNLPQPKETEPLDSCSLRGLEEEKKEDGPFKWTKQEQGLLLGAIYWTYTSCVVPGNHLLRNVRRKTIIMSSMGTLTACTLLLHVASLWSLWAVFVLKLIQGACTAVGIIAFYGLWTVWGPPLERGKLLGFSLSGQMFSNVIVFPLSALLCKYGFLGGWPSVFYVFGFISVLWLILFFVFVDETPSTSRFITEAEKNYIVSSLAHAGTTRQVKTPWKAILKSRVMWAVIFSQVGFAWNYFTFLATLPQYMLEVLKQDIQSNGVFSMLPYFALLLTTYMAGPLTDCVIKRGWLSVVWTRRVSVLFAHIVPAVCLVALSYMNCTQSGLAITLLTVGVGVTGFGLVTFQLVPFDVAPRFAPPMMTISTSLATMSGLITPYIVAAIAKDQTREQWQMVFFLTAAILVVGAIGFCLLFNGEVQPWMTVNPDGADRNNGCLDAEIVLEEESQENHVKKQGSGR